VQLDNTREIGIIVLIATQDGMVQVTGTRAGNVMLVNILVPNSQSAPVVLLENKCYHRELAHAIIVTRVRLLMVELPLATTVPRGNMPRTQEQTGATIVREESIMMRKSNQLASPVVPVSIIRM
jgi:hypothetical protein